MLKDNIKVGDYVRTKYGITQYKEYETTDGAKLLCMPVKDGSQGIFANIEDIIKSSPNIIDLIEVGDYVNGIQINERIGDSVWHFSAYGDEDECLENKDIKTIVTHEQMEAMEYKIER